MNTKKPLTNERLKLLFSSNFDLAAFAIRIGRDYILSDYFTTLDALLNEIKKRAELLRTTD